MTEDWGMIALRLLVIPLFFGGIELGKLVVRRYGRISGNRQLEKRLMIAVLLVFLISVALAALLRLGFDLELYLPTFVRMHATHFKWWGVECLLSLALGFTWGLYRTESSLVRWRLIITGIFIVGATVVGDRVYTRPLWTDCRVLERDGAILQSTPSSCGPAAVANLLRLSGLETTERALARAGRTRRSGTTGDELIRAVTTLFPDLTISWNHYQFENLPRPSVLSLGQQHFVVLLGSREHLWEVIDPSIGYLLMTEADLRREWDGKALVINGGTAR